MKLVVAGPNADGLSHVISARELPDERVLNLFNGGTGETMKNIAAMTPGSAASAVEPAEGPGGFRWVLNRVPPESEAAQWNYTPMGPHTTRTIDFDYVIEGTIHCVLDMEIVELNAGDFIVLEAARHAWRNPTTSWAIKLALLHVPSGVRTEPTAHTERG